MKKQRGQTLVEFALMAPIMFLLIFGMIYGGVMFVDYLNFNNAARTLARQIAVADSTERIRLLGNYTWEGTETEKQKFANFYDVTMKAVLVDNDANSVSTDQMENAQDVVVVVNFERDNKDLPWIVYRVGFPPKKFTINYSMKLEKSGS